MSRGSSDVARPLAYVMGDMDLMTPVGRAGIRCVAVSEPGSPDRWSRYARRSLDAVDDTWRKPEEMVERLVRAASAEDVPPVLFYQHDPELLLASRHRERLFPALRYVVPDAELVEDLVDKSRFAAYAERLDLDTPATVILQPGDGLEAVRRIPGPLIVKPVLRRGDEWEPMAGKAKAITVASHAELQSVWTVFDRRGTALTIQELIGGPETRIESYHVYVDDAGGIAAEFTGRKIRTRPAAFGMSTAVEVVEIDDVLHAGRDLIERMQLRGVAKIDFKRDAADRLRLLEVNARFNLWHHPGALAGANIPAVVYADLAGLPRPPARFRRSVTWCKPWADLPAAREAGIRPSAWTRYALGCPAKTAVSWRDPLPTIGAALFAARRKLGGRH